MGFGDQVPSLYNAVSASTTVLAVVLGSLFLSMPLAIIGNNFETIWNENELDEGRKVASVKKRPTSASNASDASLCINMGLKNFMITDDYYTLAVDLGSLKEMTSEGSSTAELSHIGDLITKSIALHSKIIQTADSIAEDNK